MSPALLVLQLLTLKPRVKLEAATKANNKKDHLVCYTSIPRQTIYCPDISCQLQRKMDKKGGALNLFSPGRGKSESIKSSLTLHSQDVHFKIEIGTIS